MADAKLIGLQRIKAKIARLPAAAAAGLEAQLKIEVDGLVDAQRRAAPVDAKSPAAGQVRDSVHAYRNPNRVLSYVVIADARDEAGKFIGSNVEAGHRAPDGSHVAGRPFFFPTYRARKKGIRRRMNAAARAAIRAEYGS